MLKPISILAGGLLLLGASSLAGAASNASNGRHNALTVIPVLGPPVNVPPGHFAKAFAFCPKGYYVTGGGAYSGAVTEIVSGPTKDLRGWFVDGTNDDPLKRSFQHRADAVCVEGSPGVVVGTATAADRALTRHDEVDFALRDQAARGG
jgi:hypothetical protein